MMLAHTLLIAQAQDQSKGSANQTELHRWCMVQSSGYVLHGTAILIRPCLHEQGPRSKHKACIECLQTL